MGHLVASELDSRVLEKLRSDGVAKSVVFIRDEDGALMSLLAVISIGNSV